ncbi:TonB-dependent receptor domain-containing protein [Chitinimonas sp.]|uniref:TonB-dependent receptor domain-containing protein n=1 Tax=Chitinimonas sp. TaxID=1934313 RepID=UPI002F941C29
MRLNQANRLSTIALALAALPLTALADNAEPAADKVVITGSRIARASQEGPTSVTVITAEQIEKQGYKNVFDALSGQTQNTGFTQGADFGNTFTPAANAISLRGLGPNHTLILVNGRRLADYPIAYEGGTNFVNLANIPSALIDRIEILNGGASAIYGSDAIAGVVNIVLKKHASGLDLNLKAGTTERGGGANQRLQLSGGSDFDKLSLIYGLEVSQRDPIWSRQRDFMADTTLHGANPTSIWSRRNLDTGRYVDPGDSCNILASAFEGSVKKFTGKSGSYCASGRASPDYWTTQTGNESQNGYLGLNYTLDAHTTLFGDVAVGLNRTKNNTRGPSWTSDLAGNGYIYNQNTQAYEVWSRRFAPEEIGSAERFNRQWKDRATSLSAGVRGDIDGTTWGYEAAYSASSYISTDRRQRLLAGIDSFYLGPKLGVDSDGVAIYAPDPARFNRALTPAEFNSLVAPSESRNKAWTQTLSLSANGELLDLPAGALKLATLLEAGSQGFSNKPDPQLGQGIYYNTAGAQDVSGKRSRYAAGAEFNIPLLKQLNATLAGRYDNYEFAGRNDSKFTYNAGLEYRPSSSLLLRSNYATSFRAPDMNYIFAAETRGYYSSSTDYYRCKLAGQPLDNCEFKDMSPGANYVQTGSKDLKSENGKSFGYGLVWSPSRSFDASIDYWHIAINDLVTNLDSDTILRDEADCRTGAKDPNSVLCLDALARVHRNPANAVLNPNVIREVMVNPINAASERTTGIDLTARYRWKWDSLGDFALSGNYTKVLSHRYRQFEKDPYTDYLNSLDNTDWPSKFTGSLSWSKADWASTLQVTRYGSIPNGAQTARLTPYALANVSASYKINQRASVSVIVNNVFDKVREDLSGGWPFYPVGNYSPHGRQGWVEFNYHFGA